MRHCLRHPTTPVELAAHIRDTLATRDRWLLVANGERAGRALGLALWTMLHSGFDEQELVSCHVNYAELLTRARLACRVLTIPRSQMPGDTLAKLLAAVGYPIPTTDIDVICFGGAVEDAQNVMRFVNACVDGDLVPDAEVN